MQFLVRHLLLIVLCTEAYTHSHLPALVCYEYFITVNDEIDILWRRKWTFATWLFILNRYLLLATVIIQASPIGPSVRYWLFVVYHGCAVLTFV